MSGLGDVFDLIKDIRTEVAKYSHHPYAIAGGCLRDAFFGKPIKDIDLVVYCSGQWTNLTEWPETSEYGPTGEFMAGDTEILVRGEYPVQLIYRDGVVTADSMIKYHSLAVSNFFYINGVLSIDPQAYQDFKDKMHTLNTNRWACQDQQSAGRLDKYVSKIQAKYPWPIRK
jgi:hypothetical protein